MRILSFFWRTFNLLIWASLRKAVYSLHHWHFCLLGNLLAWFFLFDDSTFPLPHVMWASRPIGIQSSNELHVTWGCLPVHTPILGKLDRQSVNMHPCAEFNCSDISFTSADEQGWEGENKRERDCIFMSKIWIRIHNNVYIYIYIYIYYCVFEYVCVYILIYGVEQ